METNQFLGQIEEIPTVRANVLLTQHNNWNHSSWHFLNLVKFARY